ncbi:MAG: hypothetical protein AAF433_11110 [Bacteroidota bacterium]
MSSILIIAFFVWSIYFNLRNELINFRGALVDLQVSDKYSYPLAIFLLLIPLLVGGTYVLVDLSFYKENSQQLLILGIVYFVLLRTYTVLIGLLIVFYKFLRKKIYRLTKYRSVNRSNKPICLLLRSFNDKKLIQAPDTYLPYYAKRPSDFDGQPTIVKEYSRIRGYSVIPYLCKAIKKDFNVAALGEESYSGINEFARITYMVTNDHNWRIILEKFLVYAKLIIMIPSTTKGVVEEMKFISQNDEVRRKTLFFLPPILKNISYNDEDNVRQFWNKELKKEVAKLGVQIVDYDEGGNFFRLGKDNSIELSVRILNKERRFLKRDIRKALRQINFEDVEADSTRLVFKKLKDTFGEKFTFR